MRKQIISAAILSLLAASVFFGCSSGNKDNSESSADSSASSALESVSEQSSESSEKDTESSSDDESSESSENSEASSEASDESSSDAASSTQAAETSELSDDMLIAEAQELYETACMTSWKFHVGCPYSLDYNTTIENSMGWQFYLITDEDINSLADVEEDYCRVFSSEYPNDLSEVFIEQDGRVYALAGERGSDIYYVGSEVTAIKERSDHEIVFSVDVHYSGDDYTGDTPYTETQDFSVVIADNGSWRAGQFTLPY